MRNTGYFKDKKVTIAGLARSGFACAKLLSGLGARVGVTDNQDNDSTRAYAEELRARGIKIELGCHSQDFIRNSDLIVISPGIDDSALPVILAKAFQIPVVSEIEIASRLCPATVIAVTGSSGKTTVTTLIASVLKAAGKKVFVCGNIGNPFTGEVEKICSGDYVSLEVSSFQLEKTREFKPNISLILNFARNHLDRHRDMREYLEAKKRIFLNQDADDYLVLNDNDPVIRELAKEAKSRTSYFKESEGFNSNQSAVLAVASLLGIDKEVSIKVFGEFKGLEHRMEFVAEINNVKFINDSKSTLVESTMWAFRNIPGPIILIAGGRHKGIDYSIILDLVKQKAKEVVLIGEAKDKIRNSLKGFLHIDEALALKEAVSIAFSKAKPGDYILLSPMCSSYDMFLNYEERGKAFKKAVFDLAAKV
jgi:UDP-N-acetylmuramoylalanine--D-glutamate ligase